MFRKAPGQRPYHSCDRLLGVGVDLSLSVVNDNSAGEPGASGVDGTSAVGGGVGASTHAGSAEDVVVLAGGGRGGESNSDDGEELHFD